MQQQQQQQQQQQNDNNSTTTTTAAATTNAAAGATTAAITTPTAAAASTTEAATTEAAARSSPTGTFTAQYNWSSRKPRATDSHDSDADSDCTLPQQAKPKSGATHRTVQQQTDTALLTSLPRSESISPHFPLMSHADLHQLQLDRGFSARDMKAIMATMRSSFKNKAMFAPNFVDAQVHLNQLCIHQFRSVLSPAKDRYMVFPNNTR